jgi:Asp/Glu/hydantoin racemase
MSKILVINPNSTEAVTRGIDEACEPLRMQGGPRIEVVTLKEGPPGIETQQHVDAVVNPLLDVVRRQDRNGGAAGDALEHIRAITQERDRIGLSLSDMNVECFESHANFVLFRIAESHKVWSTLLDEGVLIRDYSATPGLEECLRVTAGTPEETDAFLNAMRTVIKNV